MKHYLFFLLTLLFTLPLAGQKPDVIPDDYERKFRRLERRLDRMERREAPDVILDPIESLPIEPTFYAMETGNWGPTYLGVNQRADEIRSKARRPVVVFIFDTGGQYDHPFLKDVAWNDLGRVFTGEESGKDGHGHSTHVAGIIAATAPDYPLGIARMLPEIRLVPVKVLSNQGSGSFAWIIAGTEYANGKAKELIAKGWFVVYNYSLGGATASDGLEKAFREAEALGVLINCAANGNTGNTPNQYPGRSQYTLGVAALQQSGSGVTRASYSSYGPETWAAMPGSSILSTWPDGGTKLLSGTSMATPHLAGLFAILASVNPNATAAGLKAHYIEYAADLGSPGRDHYYGYGSGIISPMLDNPPGGEPAPPTCTDGIRNGKETGVDCGGPDCPACEPEGPPEYRKRRLPLAIDGAWSLGWVKLNTASAEPEDYDMDATALFQPAGMTYMNISRIVFEASSATEYQHEWEALEANAEAYFRNRSIGTPGGWDVYDAGRYALYFLDYYAANTAPGYAYQDLKPISVAFEWEGVQVEITRDLVDYQGPKKD